MHVGVSSLQPLGCGAQVVAHALHERDDGAHARDDGVERLLGIGRQRASQLLELLYGAAVPRDLRVHSFGLAPQPCRALRGTGRGGVEQRPCGGRHLVEARGSTVECARKVVDRPFHGRHQVGGRRRALRRCGVEAIDPVLRCDYQLARVARERLRSAGQRRIQLQHRRHPFGLRSHVAHFPRHARNAPAHVCLVCVGGHRLGDAQRHF